MNKCNFGTSIKNYLTKPKSICLMFNDTKQGKLLFTFEMLETATCLKSLSNNQSVNGLINLVSNHFSYIDVVTFLFCHMPVSMLLLCPPTLHTWLPKRSFCIQTTSNCISQLLSIHRNSQLSSSLCHL